MADISIHLELTLDEFTLVLSAVMKTYTKEVDPLATIAAMLATPALPGLGEKLNVASNYATEQMKKEDLTGRPIDASSN